MANLKQDEKPFVSVVAPAYNEALIIKQNMAKICDYMESLEDEYRWELIIVNDASTDKTGELAETFAKTRENVHVLHHTYNFRMGQALRFAFNNCKGDYIVTIDLDLSYSPDHIERLLAKIRETKAKIIIASPYMKGGRISNVPWFRRILSVLANKFLSFTVTKNNLLTSLSTLTGMVRAYDCKFLSSLNLKAMDVDINTEALYKAMILRARIVEIPAHLDWGGQTHLGMKRKSSIKILRSIVSSLLSGFMFRPFMFYIFPGLILMLFSLYSFMFVFIHVFNCFVALPLTLGSFNFRLGTAVANAFAKAPHAFIIGGISLMVAIQFVSLGLLSWQSKRYFEELFHLGSTIFKHERENEKRECNP